MARSSKRCLKHDAAISAHRSRWPGRRYGSVSNPPQDSRRHRTCAQVHFLYGGSARRAQYFASHLCLCLPVLTPEYDSPFGARTHGFANLYFQAGKYYYCAAPVLVGWWMEFVAIRRRVKAVWPTIGLLLVAWMGAAARIQASQATVHSGFRHIRIDFDFWLLIQNERDGMLHAATILLLGAIPYLLWRFRRVCAWVS
jgi:hypothetical protein